jgi:hypothetical protein
MVFPVPDVSAAMIRVRSVQPVMVGRVPTIHVFAATIKERRGWQGQALP